LFKPTNQHQQHQLFSVLFLSLAGVHGPAGLPVARPGQRGDQRDEGAARTQREHAEEHPTQPRGPALPGEGPGQ